MRLGIDIGSTTVKLVLLDEENNKVYSKYERHSSNAYEKAKEMIKELFDSLGNIKVKVVITGSGGLSLAEVCNIKFEQEVICLSEAIQNIIPETDVAIELGGEDAKITYYKDSIEQRMNGSCAGGTGAFIDQMAILLNTDAKGLDTYAKEHKLIYPIAARCGVFAKTDIQPLINEGASLEDLSASIFQSVVNQTISGLACGRKIEGNVAFLGGPLSFLPELRKRFIETIKLDEKEVIFPKDSWLFVAIGAAYLAKRTEEFDLEDIIDRFEKAKGNLAQDNKALEPLFKNQEDYDEFCSRHSKAKVKKLDIKRAIGPLFLGIDAGSTTTKASLIDKNGNLLFQSYNSNKGDPLETTKKILIEIYSKIPETAHIGYGVVTGYGENLIKEAFNVDFGEIETMAHYRAAEYFYEGVDFILDIGGQDMKAMKIKDGAIYSIMLNEACSAGCGSFLETYAKSVNLDISSFAKEGIFSKMPADLGTRCTVFMNSKVKQAQKEGASIGDISAGLSYSVIKNALYKVIKLRDLDEIGEKVVVQGGTFLNDGVLRSIEKILGKNVVRPDISGLMGAYGAALIALEKYESKGEFVQKNKSKLKTLEELKEFRVSHHNSRCTRCENKCILTINKFSNGSKFITGNRCEKGAGIKSETKDIPDLYKYKLDRLFSYKALDEGKAKRGSVGIPRVLNMYENYPFWHTFFTKLGFRVSLSPLSQKNMFQKGMETISSDTVCYPAKLVHGHIKWLIDNDEKFIFYPCINYEQREDKASDNSFNCPIVATYPEVIKNNMDDFLEGNQVDFCSPFLPYNDDKKLTKILSKELKKYGIESYEIKRAVKEARKEQLKFKEDIKNMGKKALEYASKNKKKAVVLAGRPYHLDPEINHGINRMLNSFGFIVLSEDTVPENHIERSLRVLDQWVYHSRLYKAADFVCQNENVEIVQLNSFGCGLDAVTTDQVEEICNGNNKLYTVLKIDEGSNLGAIKIRIRSLKAAIEAREKNNVKARYRVRPYERKIFTKEMKKEYTIIVPQMSPLHFDYFEAAVKSCGYKVELLPALDKNSVNEGLRYINNDACYPTIVTLGQIISALKSGKYDLDKTAIFMSQTGGGCRASNYISLLRKALKDLGMENIPVISFNSVGLEKNPGFSISLKMAKGLVIGAIYGDLIMGLLYGTRPYEANKGDCEALIKKWREPIIDNILNFDKIVYENNLKKIVEDFENIERTGEVKPKVGVVGEILVKYHPNANNDIVKIIEDEGGEAVVLDIVDFFLYGMYNNKFNFKNLSGKYSSMVINNYLIKLVEKYRKPMRIALKNSKYFDEPSYIEETALSASEIVSLGNQCGEGWLLTGEMIELMKSGVNNIVCLQPFACLPNHVTGKGMMKAIRKRYPEDNIASIDYDPGLSTANQLNRIKLMMSEALKKIES